MTSKFLKLYNILLEDLEQSYYNQKINDLKNKIEEIYQQLNDIDLNDQFFNKGQDALKNYNLNQYEPMITGEKVFKIAPNGLKDLSIIKNNPTDINDITFNRVEKNSSLNAFFYILKYKRQKNSSFEIPIRLFNTLNAETKQIKELNKKIQDSNGEIKIQTTLKNGNKKILGPFNNAEKVKGTPKADVKLTDDNSSNKLFISLKNGGKAGEFRQYGGKLDLAPNDESVLNTNPFIRKCYNLIKLLFDKLAESNPKIKKGNYDFKYLRGYDQNVTVSNLAFIVPMNNSETVTSLLKTKFGKDFSQRQSGINNVDVLTDGQIQLIDKGNDTIELNGKYHTQWNPLKYKNQITDNKDLYDFVINFIRYNANNQDSKKNQLHFAQFKHCRFVVYPKKKQILIAINKTKEIFQKYGLKNQFNQLYKIKQS